MSRCKEHAPLMYILAARCSNEQTVGRLLSWRSATGWPLRGMCPSPTTPPLKSPWPRRVRHSHGRAASREQSLHRSNRAGAVLTYNSRARTPRPPHTRRSGCSLAIFPCYEAFVFVLRQLSADGHNKIYMLSYPPPFPAAAPLRVRAGGCWAPRENDLTTYTQR